MKSGYCISTKCQHKWICARNYFTTINSGSVIGEMVGLHDFYHQNMVCDSFIKIKG